MKKTGIIWDKRFTKHAMGLGHPESPSRLLAIKEILESDGVGKEIIKIEPRFATIDELKFIHDENYIQRIENTKTLKYTSLDPDTCANAYTFDAALLAAGSSILLTEMVIDNKLTNAFAFIRPPGHHAEKDHSMGFCLFNNIAIAASYAMHIKGIDKIAIIDFDVHHGNGTQNAFYNNEHVYYFSTHRSPFFPGTGNRNEKGIGNAKGTNLNIPLETGRDDDDYKTIFDREIIPEIESYKPELILISAGFDAHIRDPIGGMKLTTNGFRWITNTLLNIAKELCKNKIVFILEGGYDLKALKESIEVSLEEMVSV